jgi:hypothetical protein
MKILAISSLSLALGAITFAVPGINSAFAANPNTYRHTGSPRASVATAADTNLPAGFYNPRRADNGRWSSNTSAAGFAAEKPEQQPTGVNIGVPTAENERLGWPNNNESGIEAMSHRTEQPARHHNSKMPENTRR